MSEEPKNLDVRSNPDCSAVWCDGTRDSDSSEAVKTPGMLELLDLELLNSVAYLRRYQDWRTGKDVRTMREAGISGAAITVAINDILTYFGMSKPLTDCTKCAHNSKNIKTSNTTGCQWALYNGDATCEYSEVTDSEEGE